MAAHRVHAAACFMPATLLAVLLMVHAHGDTVTSGWQLLLVEAKVVTYDFVITFGFWSPDCVKRTVYLVNGQYPGPTIEADEGDVIKVTVTNELYLEGVSTIHWHGIRQLNSNLQDGTSYISQCPIGPGETFTYSFKAEKAGTFMYHSHLSNQVSHGLYGKLLVKEKKNPFPYAYDDEIFIVLNDWWHRSLQEQVAGLNSVPFVWVGAPQSLLMDGRGRYDCSVLVPTGFNEVAGDVKSCNLANPQCDRPVYTVQAGKKYRLRLVSVVSLEMLSVTIQSHPLTVVGADAYTLKSFTTDELDIHSGMAIDVIFTANQPVGNYWIRAGIRGRSDATPPALGIIRYVGAEVADPPTPPAPVPLWSNVTYSSILASRYRGFMASRGGDVPTPPRRADRELILLGTQNRLPSGQLKWAINNISHVLPATPFALGLAVNPPVTYQSAFPPDKPLQPYDYSLQAVNQITNLGSTYYHFKQNDVIDVIVQNANALAAGVSEYHPWHLHGHDFWVLARGTGAYNPTTDRATFNLVDPPLRNTIEVLPYQWVAFRFKADNPGAWLFHCHVHPHLHMGMRTVFVDGKPKMFPWNTRKCGVLY